MANDDRPGVNYYLGRLDLRSNDFAAAIKKLAPLESDPALSNVSLYLGMAYMSAGQPARALECLERAARKNPRDPDVHYRLARLFSTAGRTNDANREYNSTRIGPKDSGSRKSMAENARMRCVLSPSPKRAAWSASTLPTRATRTV